MKNKRCEIFILAVVLLAQSFIFALYGAHKPYIHMDEAYSLGLANYKRVEIQENGDFYNTWHSGDYYADYLTVNKDELCDFRAVYENQKNDVHPPFYYLLLRFFMNAFSEKLTFWHGLLLNIVIYAFITVFAYLISQILLVGQRYVKEKAVVIAFVSSLTLASLTNVLFIRMYLLSALLMLVTLYLHLRLRQSEKYIPLYLCIAICALIGSLTHYYYLFYLFALYCISAFFYIYKKQYNRFLIYTYILAAAGGMSIIIFPYSINHLFSGYRGQGAISKLGGFSGHSERLFLFLDKLNRFGFNGLLWVLALLIICLWIYKKLLRKGGDINREAYIRLTVTFISAVFYFAITSVSSPYIELRYILPVCSMLLIVLFCYLYHLFRSILCEKRCNILLVALACIMLCFPLVSNTEPESLYSDRAGAVSYTEENSSVPAVYFLKSQNNRFLDDIYLFAKTDSSYIAKDAEINEQSIAEIFKGVDISHGVTVYINEGQNDEEILKCTARALGLEDSELLFSLNACKVYRIG